MNNSRTSKERDAGIPYILIRVILDRELFCATMRFIRSVIRYFFIPQFKAKFHPGSIPLVNVEHPLDACVPFKPSTVKTYLSFIRLWIKALSFVRKELGQKVDRDIAAFLDDLSFAYREAAYVYRRCLSTTRRPTHVKNPYFVLIHIADPHLYCVPSLHVLIVCLTFLRVREILARHGCADRYTDKLAELYEDAVRITETVIFIRQHSLNCISAGLYMVSTLVPQFGREDAEEFIARLFAEYPEVRRVDDIHAYILSLYDEFIASRDAHPERDYRDVLLDFLFTYDTRRNSIEVSAAPL